jgi:hypothetical protein
MAIILYNPHAEDLFGRRASWLLNRRRATDKYRYFLDEEIAAEFSVLYYVDATQSSLVASGLMKNVPFFARWLLTSVEAIVWAFLNKIPLRRIRVRGLFRPSKRDVTILFGRRCFLDMHPERARSLEEFRHIFCHLGHCFARVEEVSAEMRGFDDMLTIVAEARLERDSRWFKEKFSWYEKEVLVVPFTAQKRFVVRNLFDSRDARAVSTGTYHIFSKDPFPEQWLELARIMGVDSLHPLRRELDERRDEIRDMIEVRNSLFWESMSKLAEIRKRGESSGGIVSRAAAVISKAREMFMRHQEQYFSFDIVDLYNSFQFAIVVEEVIGFPGIGAIESMACGCAFIGRESSIYRDIGMEAGVHYFGYDGTFEGLLACVRAARADPDRAKRIADEGRRLALRRFNPRAVMQIYQDAISGLALTEPSRGRAANSRGRGMVEGMESA